MFHTILNHFSNLSDLSTFDGDNPNPERIDQIKREKLLVMASFEHPSRSNTRHIRPQDHGVLLNINIVCYSDPL